MSKQQHTDDFEAFAASRRPSSQRSTVALTDDLFEQAKEAARTRVSHPALELRCAPLAVRLTRRQTNERC